MNTEDDIMLMAQKAGPLTQGPFKEWCKRFANLIAAHKTEVALAEAYRCGHETGAELRRQHESNTELLAALKEILDGEGKSFRELCEQARAAINKAEGEMK